MASQGLGENALSEPHTSGRVEGPRGLPYCKPCQQGQTRSHSQTRSICVYTATMASSLVWFVYILRCADNSLYIGETRDLDMRMIKHTDGIGSAFTTCRRPVVLCYSEVHKTRQSALKRERQLKGWTRAKKEALIAGDLALLKML